MGTKVRIMVYIFVVVLINKFIVFYFGCRMAARGSTRLLNRLSEREIANVIRLNSSDSDLE